jgi:hypothetical protein
MRRIVTFALLLFAASVPDAAGAQQPGGCSLPLPPLHIRRANIFSEQQEQWLGDAQAEMVEPQYLLLPEDESTYLNTLGEQLLAQLPPTQVRYSFRIFESGDVRSFSLAGGHIYLSRKLVLDARNEDELAGVLAQEIGRVYSHHTATVYTRALNKLMGVKSVGDRADVFDKLQRMLNIPSDVLEYKWNPRLSLSDQQHDEQLADRIGFYAMAKAGFAPQAFDAILDRASLNDGFTGNALTDALDLTRGVSLRTRLAQKMIKSLPQSCRKARIRYRPEFAAFQNALLQQRVNPQVAPTPGLKAIHLDPPMSPALENVRLSPDAKYLLAQDEMQIHVLSRAPLKLLFSIDAPGAQMAQFTPDSTAVAFYYHGLRFETWDVATGQPASVFDFANYAPCLQDSLSPDGETFACSSLDYGSSRLRFTGIEVNDLLNLTDLRTGKRVYQDAKFYSAMPQTPPVSEAMPAMNPQNQALGAWSQDGRYFLADGVGVIKGVDVQQGKPVKLGNALSSLSGFYQTRMAFVDSDKLAFDCDWGYKEGGPSDTFKMCYATFPDGIQVNTFTLGLAWMTSITRGARLLTGPTIDAAATLFDPASGSAGPSFKLEPVDLVGDTLAAEAERGGVSTGPLGGSMQTISLPVTPLPSLEAGVFSADGRFLAISDRARSAVWDLSTGKQISLTGPFRNAQFDDQDKLQATIAGHELKPARDPLIDLRTGKVVPTLSIESGGIQYGSVVVRYKPLEADQKLDFNVAIEAEDATSGKLLWSRRFPESPPVLLDTYGDQLLLLMDRRSLTGGNELDHNKKLAVRTSDEFKEMVERGLVVEVISRRTGKPQRLVVAPETSFGGRDLRTAALFGDMLAVQGNRDNSVVYRLSDGARLLAFLGQAIAGDAGLGLIAATNRPQEVTVYEVATGKKVAHIMLDNDVLAARMISEKRQLRVLTATQHVYTLDLPAAGESR